MQLREVKDKIYSVNNIVKITKALEVVSASKMKKAQLLALNSRPFAKEILKILKEIKIYQKREERNGNNGLDFYKRFFEKKENTGLKILIVVLTSDKGFCGSFNSNILKFALKEIEQLKVKNQIEIFPVGEKAVRFFQGKEYKIRAYFTGIGDYGTFEEVSPLAIRLFDYYKDKEFDKIIIFYNHFISTFCQQPEKVQILPIEREVIEYLLNRISFKGEKEIEKKKAESKHLYLIEPKPKLFFDLIIPQLVEFEIYHLILESNASEHSARMMAMKNASENSEEILNNLSLEYNKARQSQITMELLEITSAKEAL